MTFRNLAHIKRSGSTSRILNLHLVHERFGKSEDYAAHPLFVNKRLNKAVIVKQAIRGADRYLFDVPRNVATKIILPFSNNDLGLGATNIFVGQRFFETALRDLTGGYRDDVAMHQDVELLNALDRLPSLDPFLLREQLRVMRRTPASCYFQISDADLASMRGFVGQQVAGLIDLAMGSTGKASATVTAQMASKILSDENAESLAPLRAALGLAGPEWADGVFCWKGFLYYKWMFDRNVAASSNTIAEMGRVNLSAYDDETAFALKGMRDRATAFLKQLLKQIHDLLDVYEVAYRMMAVEKNPSAFRDFLLNSPAAFLEIGETVGLLNHLCTFWEFRAGNREKHVIEPQDLIDVFQEFENRQSQDGTAVSEVRWAQG